MICAVEFGALDCIDCTGDENCDNCGGLFTVICYDCNASTGEYETEFEPIASGTVVAYKVKNIYDLAGNYGEYTCEYTSGDNYGGNYTNVPYVVRGGGYISWDYGGGVDGSVWPSSCYFRAYGIWDITSRLQLYIKCGT